MQEESGAPRQGKGSNLIHVRMSKRAVFHPVLTLRLVDKAGGSCKWPAEVARENPLTLENSTLQRVGARASHSKMYIYIFILLHTYTYTYIHDTVIHIYIYMCVCVRHMNASWSSSLIVYSCRAIYISLSWLKCQPRPLPNLAPRRRLEQKRHGACQPVLLLEQPVSPRNSLNNGWYLDNPGLVS